MATFYANQHYIAENLCVNRDNPAMHCNGHCQLNKKLQEEDHKDQSGPDRKSSVEMTVFFMHPEVGLINLFDYAADTPLNGIYKPLSTQDYIIERLHPPAV